MRAYLTFQVIAAVLIGLVKVMGMRELLGEVADDHVVVIVGVIVLVLIASALTYWVLQLQRGWSPE